MRLLPPASPSATATISSCPQCSAAMKIRLVEPDAIDSSKAWHVFECEECGLPRAYLNDRRFSHRMTTKREAANLRRPL